MSANIEKLKLVQQQFENDSYRVHAALIGEAISEIADLRAQLAKAEGLLSDAKYTIENQYGDPFSRDETVEKIDAYFGGKK